MSLYDVIMSDKAAAEARGDRHEEGLLWSLGIRLNDREGIKPTDEEMYAAIEDLIKARALTARRQFEERDLKSARQSQRDIAFLQAYLPFKVPEETIIAHVSERYQFPYTIDEIQSAATKLKSSSGQIGYIDVCASMNVLSLMNLAIDCWLKKKRNSPHTEKLRWVLSNFDDFQHLVKVYEARKKDDDFLLQYHIKASKEGGGSKSRGQFKAAQRLLRTRIVVNKLKEMVNAVEI